MPRIDHYWFYFVNSIIFFRISDSFYTLPAIVQTLSQMSLQINVLFPVKLSANKINHQYHPTNRNKNKLCHRESNWYPEIAETFAVQFDRVTPLSGFYFADFHRKLNYVVGCIDHKL